MTTVQFKNCQNTLGTKVFGEGLMEEIGFGNEETIIKYILHE